MKSIITADIFISGLPYLITNFFQGFLEEFILWASLSLCCRGSAVQLCTLCCQREEAVSQLLALQLHTACRPVWYHRVFTPIKPRGSVSLGEGVYNTAHGAQGKRKDSFLKDVCIMSHIISLGKQEKIVTRLIRYSNCVAFL